MAEDVTEWLVAWFNRNAGIERETILGNLQANFLEKGWIDSFAFISFITEVEECFAVRFSNDEFQNRDFATIEGLSGILGRKVHDRGSR